MAVLCVYLFEDFDRILKVIGLSPEVPVFLGFLYENRISNQKALYAACNFLFLISHSEYVKSRNPSICANQN